MDLIPIAAEVERRLEARYAEKQLGTATGLPDPLRVAVMGCVVNGPGEAKDAHLGVACGRASGAVFVDGRVVRHVPEEGIVDALMEAIEDLRFARTDENSTCEPAEPAPETRKPL